MRASEAPVTDVAYVLPPVRYRNWAVESIPVANSTSVPPYGPLYRAVEDESMVEGPSWYSTVW
ncbi:MAG: hypothetical protein FIA95_16430 [Gemmatimonadetes bacterium]|nr:hypothetical protein [Gemmatimonadota bacterium]